MTAFPYEHVPERDTILALTGVGNSVTRKQGFTLTRAMDVRIYALGEGRNGRMYDYGWITSAGSRAHVWDMRYDDTEPAGGDRFLEVRGEHPDVELAEALGVPAGQIFYPPYLFRESGGMAPRPSIRKAPDVIDYRGHFDLEVSGSPADIASVAILRSDHNTHSFTGGDRYVKLAFDPRGNPEKGLIRIFTPSVPAQAVPGIYMLFVVDRDGVPSMAKRVDLTSNSRRRSGR